MGISSEWDEKMNGMTIEDLITIAEKFNDWLEELSRTYNLSKDDIQELIKQFLN